MPERPSSASLGTPVPESDTRCQTSWTVTPSPSPTPSPTICFNFGVSDYTWRWRLFPPGEQVVLDREIAQVREPAYPEITLNGPADAYVLVNSLDLREDTTLHVRGTKRVGHVGSPNRLRKPDPAPTLCRGRWTLCYLPSDGRHVPRPYQLTGGKPVRGFDYAWDFVSEEAYRRADHYYQYGAFEDRIDARCQYYEVELLPSDDGTVPTIADLTASVWRNDSTDDPQPIDCGDGPVPSDRLDINTVNFAWTLTRDEVDPAYILLGSGRLIRNRRCLPTLSMYEQTTRFRLLERAPLGVIAVFYDKRDDELQSASDPAREIILTEDFEDSTIPTEWEQESGGVAAALPPTTPRSIRVLVKANRRLIHPPVVTKAVVSREKGKGKHGLRIAFWTPQSDQDVCQNIWTVSLAGIDESGVIPIVSRTGFPNFVRHSQPAAPLPLDYAGELADAWKYGWVRSDINKAMADRIDRLCTPEGHIAYATSLWFEDVVGHRSTPQELVFA